MGRSYLNWSDTNTNGLASAVQQAAVATQGLSAANADIAKIGENITKLGNDVTEKFTARREKQLNEYANNIFNNALQNSVTKDGRVDMSKLTANIKLSVEEGKANGEFWGDEEVGNIIGQNIMKNLDSIADNNENHRAALARENLDWANLDFAQKQRIYDDLKNLDQEYYKTIDDLNIAISQAKEAGIDTQSLQPLLEELIKIRNGIFADENTSYPNHVTFVSKYLQKNRALLSEAMKKLTELQKQINKKNNAAADAANNANTLAKTFINVMNRFNNKGEQNGN